MTYLEELQGIISDMHKDAYGFRPRGEAFWASLDTVEACSDKLQQLQVAVDDAIAEDNRREEIAVRNFEAAVERVIACGAGDRETAIRWMLEADDCNPEGGNNGPDYFEYLNGLPYGYLKGEDRFGTGWKDRVAA